ncbi:family finger-like domain protein [Variovorax sp. SRS16]|uniref:zinc-ribbon and DUF3426 domain-containing protein n=1 Tax=Variovorax sp. SRS16 TaxID=282217 RepID=UPI0013168E27|nr:zinc-ribbon and DUF3426 domain-containing protein [Variovorax sp. SRS16]VTU14121.1 family finger-like domain protein [Variovorax sp. SRS16]
MSLVTHCPACATTFKVVRDQLRISDGWVRCGRCSEVFDATADLQEVPESGAPSVSATPSAGNVPGPASDADPPIEPGLETSAPASTQNASTSESPVQDFEEADFFEEEQEEIQLPSSAPDTAAASRPDPDPASAARSPEDAASSAPLRFIGIVPDAPWTVVEPPVVPVPPKAAYPPFPKIDLTLPSNRPVGRDPIPDMGDSGNAQFQKALRRAREKAAKAKAREEKVAVRESAPIMQMASEPEWPLNGATGGFTPSSESEDAAPGFWRRPTAHRSLYSIAILAGLLALAAQAVHERRDAIAARSPSLRPALTALCRLTGCEISALRRKNDIVIEGASFSRAKNGDAYRLDFSLRNGASVPLAMPAVELSLRDTQDRTVVRRVLMPAEFGAPAVLSARGERAASLPITLVGAEAAALPPVAGFVVEAFYP